MVKYIVQPGDTLGNIAVKYRTTVRAIVKANGMKDPNMLHVGQIIRIPTGAYKDTSKTGQSTSKHHGHHHGTPANPYHYLYDHEHK